jgi:polyisoprenoid-binding protein YceI
MKKVKYILIAICCSISNIAISDTERYILDETHLSIGFLVDHAGYARTLGMFTKGGGSFKYNADTNIVSEVEIIIDTDSVFTNHDKRDAHLKSPDFLDTNNFPTMIFKADRNDLNLNPGKIRGNLTLLGQTKPLLLNVKINKIDTYPFRIGLSKPMVMGVSGSAIFKRSDFGMNYAVKKNLVGDEIELIIEFEARQE